MEKESRRQEDRCAEKGCRGATLLARRPVRDAMQRGAENQIQDSQERAVRVRQSPHLTTSRVGHFQIPTDLEAVQAFEEQAEGHKAEQRPPAEAQVAAGEHLNLGRFLSRRLHAIRFFMRACLRVERGAVCGTRCASRRQRNDRPVRGETARIS